MSHIVDAHVAYIKTISDLNQDKIELLERIKRLEEDSKRFNWLLKTGLAWRGCYNVNWIEGEWLYSSQYTISIIDKAREAKP